MGRCYVRGEEEAQDFARNEKEETRKAREKGFKDRVTFVVSSGTAKPIAGKQAKANEAKEEHMQWNGNMAKEMRRRWKEQDAWKKHVHGEDRPLEI